ncbi:MAG: SGNH/GDSL hydrolase family protein [Terracoccus sp.]
MGWLGNPTSIVVLGHSGATGANSNPDAPGADSDENSWATGSNPQVDSLYLRLLAENPNIKGHSHNYAVDGSKVQDLSHQTQQMLMDVASPDLVVIQTVDNDIRCDGSDPQNYRPFQESLAGTMRTIASKAPQARFFLVSQWATVTEFANSVKDDPAGRQGFTGRGPCDLFDAAGKEQPGRIAFLQDVVDHYQVALEAACTQVRLCRNDGRIMRGLKLVPGDISSDHNHLAIQGLAKMAALEWKALTAAATSPS